PLPEPQEGGRPTVLRRLQHRRPQSNQRVPLATDATRRVVVVVRRPDRAGQRSRLRVPSLAYFPRTRRYCPNGGLPGRARCSALSPAVGARRPRPTLPAQRPPPGSTTWIPRA